MDVDKIESIKKYVKYSLLLIPLIIILVIIKGCDNKNYSELEDKVRTEVSNYIKEKNIAVINERYIELVVLPEIEGLELCSEASGALVENQNGNLKITPYLECNGYKSEAIKNKSKYVTLNGDTVMLLNKGEAFNDPLYTLKKDADVEVDGYVGSNVGIYNIKYNVYVDNELKETLYRKVIVTDSDKTRTISGLENTEEPTLILYGDTEIVLAKGERFEEPGYKAVDYEDGKISRQVKIEPAKINTNTVGSYLVIYSVENSRGKSVFKTRTVNVVMRKSNLKIELTSTPGQGKTVILKLNVIGSDYERTILPDKAETILNEVTYPVTANGTYTFFVYDTYGNVYKKEIVVSEIDNIPPNGTCKAVVTSSATNVTVEASDNKGISGYNYVVDGKSSGYITNSSYDSSGKASSVKVKVKDISGNETTLPCEIENKTLVIASGRCGASDVSVTVKTCYGDKVIRSSIPLEEYLMGVLYGEEAPGINDPVDYIKAFIIFARTYTLGRIGYWNGQNKSIKSCSSDQNWCDVDMGCYRDQTQEMFDACIDYAVSYPRKDYTADTCANRVTTFPGTANVSNKTFYVNNPGWWGASSVTSNHVRSVWHGPVSDSKKEFYKKMIEETAGLVIYDASGKPASVHYYMCDDTTKSDTLCPNTAEDLANSGYTMDQLIEAYTQKYPGRTIDCYNR